MRLIQLFFESLAREVGDSDEQVHQDGNFDLLWWLLYDFENGINYVNHHLRFFLKIGLASPGMDHIGEHGSGEIKAKHVNFSIETLPYQG